MPPGRLRQTPVEQPGGTAHTLLASLGFVGIGAYLLYDKTPMGWVFIAIGAFGAVLMMRRANSIARFGGCYLELDTPINPGGKLAGLFVSPRPFAGAQLRAELRCVDTWTSRDARSDTDTRDSWQKVLWRAHSNLTPVTRNGRVEARIEFQIPPTARTSDAGAEHGQDGVIWMIQLEAPNDSFSRRFVVPVTGAKAI